MEASVEPLSTGDPTLANRYLANQLTEEERLAFEERMVRDPSLLREVELTARFKAGLASLRESGELARLLEPQRSRMPYLAAAAAVAVLAIGIGIWQGMGHATTWGAASLQALISQSRVALPLGERYTLLRLRSAERVDAIIELPASRQAIELRVLPDTGESTSRFRVTLSRIAAADSRGGEDITVQDLHPDQEGFVTLFVDSQGLAPGQYRLTAEDGAAGGAADATSFLIEIRARGAGP
jgi:hypothetical protein